MSKPAFYGLLISSIVCVVVLLMVAITLNLLDPEPAREGSRAATYHAAWRSISLSRRRYRQDSGRVLILHVMPSERLLRRELLSNRDQGGGGSN
jgi:hypothetical protein